VMRQFVLMLMLTTSSALFWVSAQYELRRLNAQLDVLRRQSRDLDLERNQLLAQKSQQLKVLRVEQLARERLNMRAATFDAIQYISYESREAISQFEKGDR